MDFEFTPDQLELRDNARAVLASACPPSLVRSVYEGTGDASGLWTTLVGLDWPALGVGADHGGLGLGFIEVGIVVEELGRVVAPSPFLATVTQFVPVLREAGAADVLGRVAAGSTTGTLAVAEGGRWRTGVRTTARPTGDGWVLRGEKTHVLDGVTAEEIAVVARMAGTAADDDGIGIGIFLVPGAAVDAQPVDVVDPSLPVATIRLGDVAVSADRVLVEPGDPAAAAVVERVLAEATAAMALSTTATCRAIFEQTLQYTKDRVQFGRPIGSFQALKHRLADMYLAVERATAVAYFAAAAIAEDDHRRPVAASMAKVAAGECQRLVVGDALQLHGGIGFTWEHDLHFLLKRAKTGDFLCGTAAEHRARLARLLGLAA